MEEKRGSANSKKEKVKNGTATLNTDHSFLKKVVFRVGLGG